MNRTWKWILFGAATLAIPAVINQVIHTRRRSLDSLGGLDGDYEEFPWTWGVIRYRVRGEGPPLLLLHGIYAGASSCEWMGNFGPLSDMFTVYAPDLLGFGISDKPSAPYSANLYTRLIEDFSREIIGGPAGVIASSLTAAYCVAAQAVVRVANRMMLVCPAGIGHLAHKDLMPSWAVYGLLETPILGTSLYNRITSVNGIQGYLRDHVYHDPNCVTDEMVAYLHAVAHQPGAHHAADAFIGGRLNIDITTAFERVEAPVIIAWGRHARMTPVEDAEEFLNRNPGAMLRVFEKSALLPQSEEASSFNAAAAEFFGVSSLTAGNQYSA